MDRRPNDCCNDETHLQVITWKEAGLQVQPPEGVIIRRCTVCKCRHFETTVDPMKIGLKLS